MINQNPRKEPFSYLASATGPEQRRKQDWIRRGIGALLLMLIVGCAYDSASALQGTLCFDQFFIEKIVLELLFQYDFFTKN